MDGVRLNDCESLKAFGINKQKLVEEITRAYAHQIYVDGFFNGDPHPGTHSFSPPLLGPQSLSLFCVSGWIVTTVIELFLIVNLLPDGLFIHSTF